MKLNMQRVMPLTDEGSRTTPSKSRIGQKLTQEKIKLMKQMLDTLRIVRTTAGSEGYGFITYLTEMAALEVQREIHLLERND